ncbi:hypothetical protein EDB83DRAFT_2319367 [Lactarius deliciosus]|nr:hypothetical protein EDB83DRAFT_2319367 [Lactarius deliciosus]
MLSVNVGFLAVPGVLPSGPSNSATTLATPSASPNQISNYLSLVASVGSIVVGLLLVRHHRTKKEEDPDGAVRTFGQAQYLFQNDHKYIGLEPMAIVFSLPWALLMWAYVFSASQGMMLFSIELLISCFRYTDLQLRLPIGIVSTFVAVPIAWCIWNSWKAKFDGTDMSETGNRQDCLALDPGHVARRVDERHADPWQSSSHGQWDVVRVSDDLNEVVNDKTSHGDDTDTPSLARRHSFHPGEIMRAFRIVTPED